MPQLLTHGIITNLNHRILRLNVRVIELAYLEFTALTTAKYTLQ